MLVIGLPLVALACLAVAVNMSGYARVVDPVDISYDVAAGSRVTVDVPRAVLTVRASQDGRVHVSAHGAYVGTKPTLAASTSGDRTAISVRGCTSGWFQRCWLDVMVELPSTLPLKVNAGFGISASGLAGPLDLVTTSGDIEAIGTRGPVDVRSDGGNIRVWATASSRVVVATHTGNVDLAFLMAPTTVRATTIKGSVRIIVPLRDVTYFVSGRAGHGRTDTSSVPSDPTSARTVTARAGHGNVTVARA